MSIIQIAYEAGKKFEKSDLGTLCLTSYGEKIVSIVNDSPDKLHEFELEFQKMWLAPKEVPFELIAFCMFHLKMPLFKKFIEDCRTNAIANNDWRTESVTQSILGVYEETWQDYELFYG